MALVVVNVLLGIIVLFFPQGEIALFNEKQIKFVSYDELMGHKDSVTLVNIDSVLQNVVLTTDDDTAVQITQSPIKDTAVTKVDNTQKTDTTQQKLVSDSTQKPTPFVASGTALILPPNNPDALKSLKNGLLNESKNKVVRILHYGDSQLEGDRVTNYLRNKMQLAYGGYGPGILLLKEPAATARGNYLVSQSSNIIKKAIYVRKSPMEDKRYGLAGAAFTMTGTTSEFAGWELSNDSLATSVAKFSEGAHTPAFICIAKRNGGYYRTKIYNKATLLYSAQSPFELTVDRDTATDQYVVPASTFSSKHTWNVSGQKKLKLNFSNGNYPVIYGVALDGYKGVAVDNFAMRGSSGGGFSSMDRALYKQQLNEMNVCAVILQYGINVVPNVRADYGYYKNLLANQLRSIKAAKPGISIIVIGPSDMSKNQAGEMVTYENLPLIRDAMKEAAMETGCCFWDLYQAMGGKNSMPAWVNKGLGQKDYTHFTYKGARYVGELLYNAIQEQVATN